VSSYGSTHWRKVGFGSRTGNTTCNLVRNVVSCRPCLLYGHFVYTVLHCAALRLCAFRRVLTSIKGYIAIHAADRMAPSTLVRMAVDLGLFEHFGTAVAREKDHSSRSLSVSNLCHRTATSTPVRWTVQVVQQSPETQHATGCRPKRYWVDPEWVLCTHLKHEYRVRHD
jgi:hypothetical protein